MDSYPSEAPACAGVRPIWAHAKRDHNQRRFSHTLALAMELNAHSPVLCSGAAYGSTFDGTGPGFSPVLQKDHHQGIGEQDVVGAGVQIPQPPWHGEVSVIRWTH